ncbi:MAG: signal peptidase I [Coxiellaceae bacterium]|nr:signal peptidase I [Coxiellaceae bacterium]
MSFNFPLILLVLTVFSGVIILVDGCFMLWRRRLGIVPRSSLPPVIDYARAFFPILLIVLLIRSFIVQPFRVPTGSLSPTILPGDMIVVTQYNYGLHWPVWDTTLKKIGYPKRGEIALFRYPVNPIVPFVKRVVGVPGDRISYIDKVFYINGKRADQKYLGKSTEFSQSGRSWPVKVYEENLEGIVHKIYRNPKRPGIDFHDVVVPPGYYMMVGDNRDNSDDSRAWGFVSQNDFIGKARFIWMSWNSHADWFHKIRWNRIGNGLDQSISD